MSRRRAVPAAKRYVKVEWLCAECESRTGRSHRLGVIIRQGGRDMIGATADRAPDVLRRVDGPRGETKLEGHCPTCRAAGIGATPQLRWSAVAAMLDELQREGGVVRRVAPR